MDTHVDNPEGAKAYCPPLDNAPSALPADCESRGMLESSLVVVATEFGQTEIDQIGCRSHHAIASSGLLAGGGVRGGQVYGEAH